MMSLSPQELERLLSTELSNNPVIFGSESQGFWHALDRLSEIAPLKAAQLWGCHADLRNHRDRLLGPAAKNNPTDFVAWMKTLSPEQQLAASGILSEIVSNSPATLAAIAGSLVGTPAAGRIVRAAMETILQTSPPEDSPSFELRFANTLPEGPIRNLALAQIALSPRVKVPDVPEVLAAIAQLPRENAARLQSDLLQEARTGSFKLLPAAPARNAALRFHFGRGGSFPSWADVQELESLAGTADYPAAVGGFVRATAIQDPSTAAAWALSIDPATDQQERLSALEIAARNMYLRRPDEARDWVEKAPLSDTEYWVLTGRKRSPSAP
jgi:hypothetical protein